MILMKLKTLKKQTIISGRIIIISIVKMENPFEIILERLDRIEKTIEQLNANGPSANYKFTSEGSIPHYKNGKKTIF
jgi:hypothetical protein